MFGYFSDIPNLIGMRSCLDEIPSGFERTSKTPNLGFKQFISENKIIEIMLINGKDIYFSILKNFILWNKIQNVASYRLINFFI